MILSTPYTVVDGSVGTGLSGIVPNLKSALESRDQTLQTAHAELDTWPHSAFQTEAHSDPLGKGHPAKSRHLLIQQPTLDHGKKSISQSNLLYLLLALPPDMAVTVTIDRLVQHQWKAWDWLLQIGFDKISLGSTQGPRPARPAKTQSDLHQRLCATLLPDYAAELVLAIDKARREGLDAKLPIKEDDWLRLIHHTDPRVRATTILHPQWFDVNPALEEPAISTNRISL